ncbi:MAG: lysoplasmalogenase [Ilumatobacteraceae bacterium]
MLGGSAFLLPLAAVAALVDWWAVAQGRDRVERLAKPVTMAALVGVSVALGHPDGDVRTWLVVGAVFGLLGDVALLRATETAFMAGLGAFAVGHLAYAVAAVRVGFDVGHALPGLGFMIVLLGFRFLTRILPGAARHGGTVLGVAVGVYAVVISTMVVTAWGTGVAVAALGAMAFAVSDWVLGHERFVGPLPGGRLVVMVPYHVGQALLIVGLATA